jgi:hypothetical protein
VSQQHVKATQTNLKWLSQSVIWPIMPTRSLFDVPAVRNDHYDPGREMNGLPCG